MNFQKKFISNSNDLNCDFGSECLWYNVKTDNVMDTSDFYQFKKVSDKPFPYQLTPSPVLQPAGKQFLLAGNVTTNGESAVIMSAPIACQQGKGKVSFEYWIYNHAKVEVLLLKPFTQHGHLQLIDRPYIGCTGEDNGHTRCSYNFPTINQPFQIGIRAFNLKDASTGSFLLISNITYEAESLCVDNPLEHVFGAEPLKIKMDNAKVPEINLAADLTVETHFESSHWWNKQNNLKSNWLIGYSTKRWQEMMFTNNKPSGKFLYQYVDALTPKPYGILESSNVACTRGLSSISFKIWMTPGVQVSMCTMNMENIGLSCVDINDNDIYEPIIVDVDPSQSEMFKFTFEIITFDRSRPAVVAIDNLSYEGYMCHEKIIEPTSDLLPETLVKFFLPIDEEELIEDKRSFDCNYEVSQCREWVDLNSVFQRSAIPPSAPFFLPQSMEGKGNVAVFYTATSTKILKSPEIPCSTDGQITINYFVSPLASMKVCIFNDCVEANPLEYSMNFKVTSSRPFRITIQMTSTGPSFIILKSMKTDGDFCKLMTINEIACRKIQCFFTNSTCNYNSFIEQTHTTEWQPFKNLGAISVLDERNDTAILKSPKFELASPIDIEISVLQSTYGSRLFMCEDEKVENLEYCEQLMGPKLDKERKEILNVRLESDVTQFAIVGHHDKYMQFGKAIFLITSIKVSDTDGRALC
uniref:MAM domain-containing protein n=1 Tax=Rhabditophanes sp. KR3021 TaxID=114890 RepID=A0AC35U8M9_9BILA